MRTCTLIGPRGVRLHALVPENARERMVGLRRVDLRRGDAMLFLGCRSVQTFGIRRPLRIVGLDETLVVRWVRAMGPGRVVMPRIGTRHVLELGTAQTFAPGDRLTIAWTELHPGEGSDNDSRQWHG